VKSLELGYRFIVRTCRQHPAAGHKGLPYERQKKIHPAPGEPGATTEGYLFKEPALLGFPGVPGSDSNDFRGSGVPSGHRASKWNGWPWRG